MTRPRTAKGRSGAVIAVALLLSGATAHVAEAHAGRGQEGDQPLTLEALERMAVANNPTLRQADALIREAQGNRDQAGRYPNPRVGYAGEEIAFRDPARTSEHLFVAEQEILLGGKRARRTEVFAREEERAEALREAQRLRVQNNVRVLYYQTIAAAQLVATRGQLAEITRDGLVTTRELVNVGQADPADLLAADVEASRAELEARSAQTSQRRIWRQLAATVGDPSLRIRPLAGSVGEDLPTVDWDESVERLLAESPELAAARADVRRAEAVLGREGAEVTPDLNLRGGIGYNFDRFELGPDAVGLEMFVEATFPLPLFDRRQGNRLAAAAEIDRARQEVIRRQLSLRSNLAEVFGDYNDARMVVETYRDEVIPRAEEAVELYESRFAQMGAAYPQVLIARRNLQQLRVSYVEAWAGLWRSVVTIRGMLLVDGLAGVVS